jgi:molybdopterin converting factor small subunit
MRVRVLLGGCLGRECAPGARERTLDLPQQAIVGGLLDLLGLANHRVKLILVNGRGATLDTSLDDGDRVALFPPELSFNTFVSFSFRREFVEGREKQTRSRNG